LSLAATGVCVRQGQVISVETLRTTPRTCGSDLLRLAHIRDEVMSRIPACTAMVCVEDIFMPRQQARIRQAINLAQLAGVVRVALVEAGFPFFVVGDGQLKKYACGKGSGVQKSIIVREVYRKWGVEAKDDNQADGCVLAYLAETIFQIRRGEDVSHLPKYQIDVARKVIKERPRYNV